MNAQEIKQIKDEMTVFRSSIMAIQARIGEILERMEKQDVDIENLQDQINDLDKENDYDE